MRAMLTAVATVCAGIVAGPASAADVGPAPTAPVTSPPYIAPLYDWTGLYVGVHGGAGWSGVGNGPLGGGQVGYNQQLDALVFGIEGDLSFTDIRGSTTSPLGVNISTRLNWVGTVTGRLGIAWDRTLLYAKAGAAFAETTASIPLVTFKDKDTRAGWTIGAGAEYGLWDNWSIKAEYNYIDLGTRTVTAPTPGGGSIAFDSKVTEHMIKLGANYRFKAQ